MRARHGDVPHHAPGSAPHLIHASHPQLSDETGASRCAVWPGCARECDGSGSGRACTIAPVDQADGACSGRWQRVNAVEPFVCAACLAGWREPNGGEVRGRLNGHCSDGRASPPLSIHLGRRRRQAFLGWRIRRNQSGPPGGGAGRNAESARGISVDTEGRYGETMDHPSTEKEAAAIATCRHVRRWRRCRYR